jgi:hypothetical protein
MLNISTHAAGAAEQSGPGNTTTKADLFSRAKDAIEAGDQSLHAAAEALALAQEDFKASQREIAEAVGKSPAWVNRLLRWRCEGCVGSPFGPGSLAGRKGRKGVQSTEQRAAREIKAESDETSAHLAITPNQSGGSEKLPSGFTSNDALSGFNSHFMELKRRISRHPVERFQKTPVPPDDIQRVGYFLIDLARALKEKAEAVEPAPIMALPDILNNRAEEPAGGAEPGGVT